MKNKISILKLTLSLTLALVASSAFAQSDTPDTLMSTQSESASASPNAYQELLQRIWRSYLDFNNGFHTSDTQKKINDAYSGFYPVLDSCEKNYEIASKSPDSDVRKREAQSCLRVWDLQILTLQSAVASAARADATKVAQTMVDQAVAARKAAVQQATDRDMRMAVERLGADLRNDFIKISAGT